MAGDAAGVESATFVIAMSADSAVMPRETVGIVRSS
jgi:hypothetical protein